MEFNFRMISLVFKWQWQSLPFDYQTVSNQLGPKIKWFRYLYVWYSDVHFRWLSKILIWEFESRFWIAIQVILNVIAVPWFLNGYDIHLVDCLKTGQICPVFEWSGIRMPGYSVSVLCTSCKQFVLSFNRHFYLPL
jgi:hypothetical protein